MGEEKGSAELLDEIRGQSYSLAVDSWEVRRGCEGEEKGSADLVEEICGESYSEAADMTPGVAYSQDAVDTRSLLVVNSEKDSVTK